MGDFYFKGEIPSSKSVMNRALVLKSFFPKIEIEGDSSCEDVTHMTRAVVQIIESLEQGENKSFVLNCGEGGTVLRFLAFRISRIPGEHLLLGSERLFERPQKEIISILQKLGVEASMSKEGLVIKSNGWKDPQGVIEIDRSQSSQFASGLVLSAWALDFPLKFSFSMDEISESYWQLTLKFLERVGLKVEKSENIYTVSPKQKCLKKKVLAELDISSAFAIAAAAALNGHCEITNFYQKSDQPDKQFVEIFKNMGISIKLKGDTLTVEETQNYKGAEVNLSQAPDLFPVLAVVCGYAKGTSRLMGAPHIVAKESNRLLKTKELLQKLGILCAEDEDGLLIQGSGGTFPLRSFEFYPDHDHRMAMAAGIASLLGHDIHLLDKNVVKKSFPEFWTILGKDE